MRQSACGTDAGRKRLRNEDSMLCMDPQNFYMLADGVGGHNSGEIASGLAVEIAEQYILKNPLCGIADSELSDYFNSCLQYINQEIHIKSKAAEDNLGMATTAIMMYIRSTKAFITNIGDSRAYHMRNGTLTKITDDHTYVNELLKQGCITVAEADVHPKRNIITRALGSEEIVKPDFYSIDIKEGDRILLCTDGLYNEVVEKDIEVLMNSKQSVSELVASLIKLACDNGGRDNITVSCVEI